METNPKIGPARKETSKIARKLKSSDETVMIFVSPQMVLDIPYETPEAVAIANIDLCE